MDYWQQSDHALETEYEFGQAVLMVNKQPLVEMPDPEKNRNSIRLVTFKVKGNAFPSRKMATILMCIHTK